MTAMLHYHVRSKCWARITEYALNSDVRYGIARRPAPLLTCISVSYSFLSAQQIQHDWVSNGNSTVEVTCGVAR